MTIQYVGGTTASIAGFTSGTASVSLTSLTGGLASAPAQGDLIVVAYATTGTSDLSLTIQDAASAAYTSLADLWADDTFDTNFRAGYKFAGGTPDTQVLVGPTTNTAWAGAVAVHVWRGVDLTTPLDVTTTTATGIDSSRADPPSITPTTAGAVILAIGAGNGSGSMSAAYTSSDLSNFITLFGDDTLSDTVIGIGSKAWTSGAFDPAVFGNSTTNTSSSWAAITLALRPGGFAAAVGLATETDTALGLTGKQARATGLATEADTALALIGKQARATGLATETDTALALLLGGTPVGLAIETDTALSLAVLQRIGAGLATETDTALALAGLQRIAAGLTAETDTAIALAGLLIVPAVTPPERRLNLARSRLANRTLALTATHAANRRVTLPTSRLTHRTLTITE